MQPSSLIFVVIVGVWAVFFVQYWIRRREHIATARSVDAFSETMRVLKLPEGKAHVDLSRTRPSYALSPTRGVRPQITVKRAAALLAERGSGATGWQEAEPVGESVVAPVPGLAAGHVAGPTLAAGGATRGPSRAAYPAVGAARVSRASEGNQAVRGLTFLVGLLATIVYAALSAFGVLVPWAVVVPLLLVVGGFLWLRAGVLARGHSASTGSVARSARSAAPPAVARSAARADGSRSATVEKRTEVRFEPLGDESDLGDDSFFDVEAIRPTGRTSQPQPAAEHVADPSLVPAVARSARPLVDEDDLPLTWDPVPVPRPTYTLKAQARRVPVAPPAAVAPSPVMADFDDDIPDSFPTRRAVGS